MKTISKALAVTALIIPMGASACFLSGERTSGLNKICYYDCASGTRAITIRGTALCPLSLYRDLRATMGLKWGVPLRSVSCG